MEKYCQQWAINSQNVTVISDGCNIIVRVKKLIIFTKCAGISSGAQWRHYELPVQEVLVLSSPVTGHTVHTVQQSTEAESK
jgi:hypothetical protein